jgi:hypothetical protein
MLRSQPRKIWILAGDPLANSLGYKRMLMCRMGLVALTLGQLLRFMVRGVA